MKKKIAHFDRDKCVGCGACVNACLEGAVALVDGKAMLVKEDHCDDLGNCLPNCPVEAISEGEIYVIDPDTCIECGTCAEVCPSEAIIPGE